MARLPDVNDLGARPIPQSRQGIASNPAAGVVGQAVAGLGQTVEAAGAQQMDVRDKLQYATARAAVLKADTDTRTALRDDPDYSTYGARYKAAMGTAQTTAAASIADKEDRATFETQTGVDINRGAYDLGELAHAKAKDAKVAAGQGALDTSAQVAVSAPDDKTREQALLNGGQIIDGLAASGAIDATTAQREKKNFAQSFFTNSVKAAIATGDLAEAKRRAATFKDRMAPATFVAVNDDIDVEQRRADAVAKAQQALKDKAARESLATVTAQVEAGIHLPDETIAAAQNLANSMGDTSGGVKFGALRISNGVNRETQPWAPGQYDVEISRLRAKGDKATPDEQVRLKALETIAPSRKAEFKADPWGWAALSGHTTPPVNFTDPASITARVQAQSALSATTGQPAPFFNKSEADQLQAQAADSPKAKFAVINEIGNIAAVDPHRAQSAARQVFPDDPLAVRLVALNPATRAAAISGAEARKADKTLIDGTGNDAPGTAALEKYQRDVEPALALLRPEDAHATYEIAANMYANWAHQHGVKAFNEDAFGTFLHTALGAKKDAQGVFHGGVGYWNDAPVWLPSRQSQQQFETVMSRMLWKPDDPHAPVFANGQPMTPADIRKLTPIQRQDGQYEFHGSNGVAATNRQGQFWTVDLDKFGKGMGIAP